jgi:hypothetical protein
VPTGVSTPPVVAKAATGPIATIAKTKRQSIHRRAFVSIPPPFAKYIRYTLTTGDLEIINSLGADPLNGQKIKIFETRAGALKELRFPGAKVSCRTKPEKACIIVPFLAQWDR